MPTAWFAFAADNRVELSRLFDRAQEQDSELSSELVEPTLCAVKSYIQYHNQFLTITRDDERVLEALHLAHFARLASALRFAENVAEPELAPVFSEYYRQLGSAIEGFWKGPAEARAFVFAEPLCREYSPELQLRLLNLSPSQLQQPVLDLGCGRQAALVRYLRDHGVDAYGIDRDVEPAPKLWRADWLEFAFERNRWGTVLSHMGFTNHFVFQHQLGAQNAEQYARTFLTILRSLREGGRFAYAPSVGFFEQHLPQQHFRVDRYAINPESKGLASLSGELLQTQAVHITRRS